MTKLAHKQTVVVLVLAAVLANSIPAGGEEPERAVIGTWEAIKALPFSDDLTVTLKDGTSTKGKLSNVTDTTLSLGKGKKLTELPREGIFQIYRSVPRSRKRGAWIGGSVGAALGALSGVSAAESSSGGEAPAGAIALGIAVTAALGILIGRGIARSSERILIYETRR
jgi:hypothetical protein